MYKIGLVEQNEKLSEILCQVLTEADFEVLELKQSAKDVQQELDKYHPDFLIMDIRLSDESLIKTCNAIKREKSTKYIPLIVLSNNPLIKQRISISCTDQVLNMPFKLSHLLDSIQSRLDVIHSLDIVN